MTLRLIFLFFIFLISLSSFTQKECNQSSIGIPVLICSITPSIINICEETKTVTFEIENTTTFTLSSVTATLSMLNGVVYEVNSISGSGATESNITDLSNPIFIFNDITPGIKIFTLDVKVNCDIYNNSPGSEYRINFNLDYIANGTISSTNHLSAAISILEPALSIINVTNQVYSGSVGEKFERCITVTNQGLGYLSSFNFTENHGGDVTITSVDLNNIISQSGTSVELNFGPAEIAAAASGAFGDGDVFFENGESIVFCDSIRIDGCEDVASEYNMFWGCDGKNCQSGQGGGTESANVIFPGAIPDLKVVRKVDFALLDTVTCLDDALRHKMVLRNEGTGRADNTKIHIYTAYGHSNNTSTYFSNGYNQYFDTNNISIIHNGITLTAIIDSVYISNSSYNSGCSVVNPVQGIVLILPSILAGDSLEIDFEINHCENINCNRDLFNGWSYKFSYQSVCNDVYNVGPFGGRQRTHIDWGVQNDIYPSNFADGQTQTISYRTSYFAFSKFYNLDRGKWIMNFTKNSCFSFADTSVRITNAANTLLWESTKITEYDSVIVAEFSGKWPFNPNGGDILFNLQANCADCPTDTIDINDIPECSRPGGSSISNIVKETGTNISLNIIFIPDTNCNQEMEVACNTFVTEVNCPGCDSGLIVTDYEFIRYTVGNPDVNNDGLPDNNGLANNTGLRLDRAILGDTIKNRIVSVMNFPNGSKWNLAYSRARFTNNLNAVKFLLDTIEVHRNGAKYVSDGIKPSLTTNSTTNGEYLFNISTDTLSKYGNLPNGFLFEHGDSIIFKSYYKVVRTPFSIYTTGGSNVLINGEVSIHINDSVESTRECHRFYCESYPINLTLIRFNYYSSYGSISSSNSCDSILISRAQYLSIGPWTSYGWSNDMFPNEYRNFGSIDTIIYQIPQGYEFSMAKYRETRKDKTQTSNYIRTNNTTDANLAYIPISPSNPDSSHLIFNIKELHDNGTIDNAHGGHHGVLQVSIKPTCNTVQDIETQGKFTYKWNGVFGDSTIRATQVRTGSTERFRYDAPKIQLQANNPNLFALDDTIAWTVRVSNLSNISSASNVWLADFYKNTGVNILRIHDIDNGGLLNEVNGIYQINQVNELEERVFMIVANFSSCVKDSLRLALGWDCPGYPDSALAYECTPDFVTLTVTPRLPNIQTDITLESDSIRLCDTATYIVYMKNVLQGTAYNFNLKGIIPSGVDYILGTSQIDYPFGSGIVNVSDPIINGGFIEWDISGNEPFINTNGFHGIGDPTNNEIEVRFQVLTDCDYTSGSKFNFYSSVVANCGDTIESDVTGSTPLVITDAVPPYKTYNAIGLYQITPCSGNTPVIVTIANQGPGNFWTTDSVTVELPDNITYQGNYIDLLNGPLNSTLTISYNAIGNQVLNWKLPQGLLVGDTSRFSFDVQGNADTLTCTDIPRFSIFTTASSVATCASNNTICSIKTITGDSTKNTFVLKSYPLIQNLGVTSVLLPPNGEQLTIDLDILNSGEPIQNGYNTTFEIYQDVDNSGTYTLTDTLIGSYSTTDSIDGNNNLTHFTFPVNILSGQGCAIFVRLDSISSSCFCNSDVTFANVALAVNLKDTILCSGTSVNIGVDSTSGYIYTWNDASNLNAISASNPTYSGMNNTLEIDSLTKTVIVDRGGCLAYDTMEIYVYPQPIITAGADVQYCETDTIQLNGNLATSFETSYWETLINTSVNSIMYIDSLLGNTQITGVGYGEFTLVYHKSNQFCPSFTDTVQYVNYEQPSILLTDIYICNLTTTPLTAIVTPTVSLTQWSTEVSGITYMDSSIINTTAQNINLDSSKIYLEATNGVCLTTRDSLIIMNVRPHNSILPPDTSLCEATSLLVIANGLDSLNLERGVWHIDSNYNTSISLSVVDDSSVTINGLTYGEQRIVREIQSDYCPSHYDTMAIVIYEQPTALANPLFLCDKSTAVLSGSKTPIQSISEWKNSTLSTIIFDDSSAIPTNISFINYGASDIYLEVTNGVCPIAIDTVEVRNLVPHDAVLSSDISLCEQTLMLLVGNGPKTANLEIGKWHIDSNFNPNIVLTPVNDSSVTVNGLEYGESRIIWEMSSVYCLSDFDTISIFMFEQPQGISMNDTSLCEQNQLPLSSGFYPTNATSYNWSLDPNTSHASLPPITVPLVGLNNGSYTTTSSSISPLIVGTYTLLWTVGNGVCPAIIDTVRIMNNPKPIANYTNAINEICQKECIDFIDISTVQYPDNIIGWEWFQNDSSVSKDKDPQICYSEAQTNTMSLIVTTNNTCKDTSIKTNLIIVKPNPIAGFLYSPEECLQIDDMIFIKDLSQDAAVYNYSFGDGFISSLAQPNHYYTGIGDYNITQAIENNLGCVDTIRFSLFIDEQTSVYVPNAFSPDGDGVNEEFYPVSSGISEYTIEIFNRWGNLIYKSDAPNKPWNGKYNNQLCKQDVYIYSISYIEKCGLTKKIKGHVTIIR
jgi:gliding motility-associated-like protein